MDIPQVQHGSIYLTPQEVAIEAHLPIEVIYAMRDGKPVQEEHARRALRVINTRLGMHIHLNEVQFQRQVFLTMNVGHHLPHV